MFGLPHLLGVVTLAAGVSGCSLLDLLLGAPPDFDPSATFPIPTAAAKFTSGSATIKLAGETLVLGDLADGGSITDDFGVSAVWTNGDGWYLSVTAIPDMGIGGGSSMVSINRIFDGKHWLTFDPSRCVTTTTVANATGIEGTAVCRGLLWSDFFSLSTGLGLPRDLGEPAFDADISFQAH